MFGACFVDNKLCIHFSEDKTESILFGSKHRIQNSKSLNIQYNCIKTKQYSKVTYLDYTLDETLAGESIAIQLRLRFLYRQNIFYKGLFSRLLCNAMIQLFFNYACNA